MKKANSKKRLLCAVIAFVTVLVSMPFAALEAGAEVMPTSTYRSITYDFNDGIIDKAVNKTYINGVGEADDGFSAKSVTSLSFYADPENAENIVVGVKSGDKNAALMINDDFNSVLGNRFAIEAEFYFSSFTTSSTPLSLFALGDISESNVPLVRLSKSGVLDLRNASNSYTTVDSTVLPALATGKWYKIRVEVNELTNSIELYVDDSYIASSTIKDLTSSGYFRILYAGGTYSAYIDNLSIQLLPFDVSLDFNGGAVNEAVTSEYLSQFGGGAVENMQFCKDPADESNVVIGKGASDGSGSISIGDEKSILAGQPFSIEFDIYVNSGPTATTTLVSWNNGESEIPFIKLKKGGVIQITNSEGEFSDTKKTLSSSKWYNVRLDVNSKGKQIALYVDGSFVASNGLPAASTSSFVKFLQTSGTYDICLDNIAVKRYLINKLDALIDFDQFAVDENVTASKISADAFPLYGSLGDDSNCKIKAVADPVNADNMVSTNTANGYQINLQDPFILLPKCDFAVSADVRFSTFPELAEPDDENSVYTTHALLSWVNGSSTYPLVYVDTDGNIVDRSKNLSGKILEEDMWHNVTVHCSGSTGEFDVYVDDEYLYTDSIGATPSKSTATSYIRVLRYQSKVKYSVLVDDIMLYESPRTGRTDRISDVIYSVDFEEFDDDYTLTKNDIDAMSDVSDIRDDYAYGSWTNSSVAKITTFNGSKALKITEATHGKQLDLQIGNNDFDPLKNQVVRVSMDLNFEKLPKSDKLQLLRWRRADVISKTNATVNLLDVDVGGNILFLESDTGKKIEANKTYNFEIIFNDRIVDGVRYCDVTVSIENLTDNTDRETIISAYPVLRDSNIVLTAENYSYFLDDAGNKRFLPYYGFVKSYRLDSDGNKLTDADGAYIYDDKLVNVISPCTDSFRMFQGFGTYYLDNFVIEVEDDRPLIDFEFEGWERISGIKYDLETKKESRVALSDAKIVSENNNTYVQLPNATSQKHFFIGDRALNIMGKDVLLETSIYLPNAENTVEGGFASQTMLALITQPTSDNPFDGGSDTKYSSILYADSEGLLYTASGQSRGDEIGALKKGGWTKVGVALKGTGEYWTNYSIYIDGSLAALGTFSSTVVTRQQKAVSMSYRFTNIKGTTLNHDNISITPIVSETGFGALTLGFEKQDEQNAMIEKLGGLWQFGVIGTDRALVFGDEDKYLRIDHTELTADRNAYVDVTNDAFLGDGTYIIETSFRYSAKTAYALNVATVYRPADGKGAPLLAVRGGTNKMFVTVRGIQYDVVNKAGKLLYANDTGDNGFTDVAILVDNAKNSYTLYINNKLAYYNYDGEILPCVDVPMHFKDDSTVITGEDFVRLLEIPATRFSVGTLDIGHICAEKLANGLSAEIIGSQTRAVLGTLTYDVRFVAGIDSLYAGRVGYEVTAEFDSGNGMKTVSDDFSARTVFSQIEADDKIVTAESLDSKYLMAIAVLGIDVSTEIKFTVKPYVDRGETRIYGETYTATFKGGSIVNQ